MHIGLTDFQVQKFEFCYWCGCVFRIMNIFWCMKLFVKFFVTTKLDFFVIPIVNCFQGIYKGKVRNGDF